MKVKNLLNKDLISIIIPVYNVEEYLAECLDSLLNQTYGNFEIILINDGSIDNSLNVCNEYSKKDKRIKLYSQKNKGVSCARNLGLEKSSGDYIMFVDSDDYCDKNMLKTIEKELEQNTLLTFGYIKKYKNKEITFVNEKCILSDSNLIEEALLLNQNIGGFICNKVFSGKIIKDNNLKFDTNINYSEDLLFSLNYIKYCNKLKNIDFAPYYYRMRKSSVSFSFINKKNASVLSLYEKLIKRYSDRDRIKLRFEYLYLVDYWKFKKYVKDSNFQKYILGRESQILKQSNLSFLGILKYRIVYKNIIVYLLFKKIKGLLEKTYE